MTSNDFTHEISADQILIQDTNNCSNYTENCLTDIVVLNSFPTERVDHKS